MKLYDLKKKNASATHTYTHTHTYPFGFSLTSLCPQAFLSEALETKIRTFLRVSTFLHNKYCKIRANPHDSSLASKIMNGLGSWKKWQNSKKCCTFQKSSLFRGINGVSGGEMKRGQSRWIAAGQTAPETQTNINKYPCPLWFSFKFSQLFTNTTSPLIKVSSEDLGGKMEQASCCSHPILSHGDLLMMRKGPLGQGAHTSLLLECAPYSTLRCQGKSDCLSRVWR